MVKHINNTKRVAYFFTSFPKLSERFLQREIEGLDQHTDLKVEIHSLLGKGYNTFGSYPVIRFTARDWINFPFRFLYELFKNPSVFFNMLLLSVRNRPKSSINALEHLLGLSYAVVRAAEFRKTPSESIHAAWATGPASAALFLHHINNTPFSIGCHAYDLFRDGGDMLLLEKSKAAKFIHTSTSTARSELIRRGVTAEKIHLIRRSAPVSQQTTSNSAFKRLRSDPSFGNAPIRILSVGRLIAKKGYPELLKILQYLSSVNINFTAQIIGDGPLRKSLQKSISDLGLKNHITLLGSMPYKEVDKCMRESTDFFFFTGKQATSGDRDGLPNVIIEAMVAGVPVLASPSGAISEAIVPGLTGELLDPCQPELWVCAVRKIKDNPSYAEELRKNARSWVAQNCDARRNAEALNRLFLS